MTYVPWSVAMERAVRTFYRTNPPIAHFRTSVHASPLFAGAILTLLERVDAALGRPDRLDLVDVGAGRGELLLGVLAQAPAELRNRLVATGVDITDQAIDGLQWTDEVPDGVTGLVVANEWLDNLPVDVVERDGDGVERLVLVDPATGAERPGDPLASAWADRWWPRGERAEIGATRDRAWSDVVGKVHSGLALAIDYGHTADSRPPLGTLTGYRAGQQVAPVPDGRCDVTAHVAIDAVAATVDEHWLGRQRQALAALGVRGTRPPYELSRTDPAAYLRALAGAGQAAELTDPGGLGGFWWLACGVGLPGPTAALLR